MSDEWKKAKRSTCRKCQSKNVRYRVHTSGCGSWDDEELNCLECGHTWWVDGCDA